VVISTKIQQENAKWTGAIIYIWCFIVLPPGAPVKACTTFLCGQVGQRAMSTSKWMVFGPVDLAHSEKLPFHQRHPKKRTVGHLTF